MMADKEPAKDDHINSNFICIGDYICLFCEDTQGYAFSTQTSSVNNSIFIYNGQNRDKPLGVPDPRAVVFQICIQNRYKLAKKYRQLQEADSAVRASVGDLEGTLERVKAAADAEQYDNVSEQQMNNGRRLRYGEIIQLRHCFTEKFIHISSNQTSQVDVNNRKVTLEVHSAKHAQFRLLPRYKVRSIGESVQILDQIILESVKAPGNYLHASAPDRVDSLTTYSEMNLGGEMTRFTVVLNFKPQACHHNCIRGGSVIRLFHKDLEAYLVAEGLFDEQVTEDVHLRIREKDLRLPRTLRPSTSAITYWQVEAEDSILWGDPLHWQQQVRFRHMCTRQYLVVRDDMHVGLTPDALDPKTVFRLHPLVKDSEEVCFDSYARIQHVLTSSWLHELRGEAYERRHHDVPECTLPWDGASLRRIRASRDRKYQDAFTLQPVKAEHLSQFSKISGMVPFVLDMYDKKNNGAFLNAKQSSQYEQALIELRESMLENGAPTKNRQKLLRNLRIVDVLQKFLTLPLCGQRDEGYMVDIVHRIYAVIGTYLTGVSRKNSLYFAKYIGFCQSQLTLKLSSLGLTVAHILVELVRDKQDIISYITRGQVDYVISLLHTHRHPYFLDLLGVLCVCQGKPLADNQNYITQNWLEGKQEGMLLTERGQIINREANVMYISTDRGDSWVPLHEFVNKEHPSYEEELVMFLEHQLDLFGKLCWGRNQYSISKITWELGILAWEEAFICLRQDTLADTTRAMYCRLISELFINVGHNYPTIERQHCCVVYDEIDPRNPSKSLEHMKGQMASELDAIFPALDEWIRGFLAANSVMVANQTGRNKFLKQVLHMLHYLVLFGFYNEDESMEALQSLVLNLLDGRTDRPFPVDRDKRKGPPKSLYRLIQQYTEHGRYKRTPQNDLIIEAKFKALEIVEILLALQTRIRLRSFIALYKQTKLLDPTLPQTRELQNLMDEKFDPFAHDKHTRKTTKTVMKVLNQMFERNALMDTSKVTQILMDLARYEYHDLVMKALGDLNVYYSARGDMFDQATKGLVLTRVDSVRVHREAVHHMPRLRRLVSNKLEDSDASYMSHALDNFLKFVDSPPLHGGTIAMQQNILINHGVIEFAFGVLDKFSEHIIENLGSNLASVVRKSAKLIRLLAKDNSRAHRLVFDNIEMLLEARGVEAEVAAALVELFSGSTQLCITIAHRHLEKIVQLTEHHSESVPELVNLLCVLVKPAPDTVPLKRNQIHVMKHVMHALHKIAAPFDTSRETREQILLSMNKDRVKHIERLTELFALCAEGDNRFIESICNTVMPLEENLWVISHPDVSLGVKRPFIKFLHNVYMKCVTRAFDPDVSELCQNKAVWILMERLADHVTRLNAYIKGRVIRLKELGNFAPHQNDYDLQSVEDPGDFSRALVHFLFDAGLPFIKTLFTKFPIMKDRKQQSPEFNTVCYLANVLVEFSYGVKDHLQRPDHLKILTTSVVSLLAAAAVHESVVRQFLWEIDTRVNDAMLDLRETDQRVKVSDESTMNRDFEVFTEKYRQMYEGPNTVAAQLGCRNKWLKNKEYSQPGSEESLPLGEEFQQHMRCFTNPAEKCVQRHYVYAEKLIQYLGISASMRQGWREDSLDMKCLQILRAMIHNEVVRLPDDWDREPRANQAQLQKIREIQSLMVDKGIVANLMPMLGSKNDGIFRATVALLCSLLFNANKYMQDAIMKYFQTSGEEVFFAAIRARVESAKMALKDRRSQISKERTCQEEDFRKQDKDKFYREQGKEVIEHIAGYAAVLRNPQLLHKQNEGQKSPGRKGRRAQIQDDDRQRLLEPPRSETFQNRHNLQTEENASADGAVPTPKPILVFPVDTVTEPEAPDAADSGNLGIILELLAMLCDGQHRPLQNYLRDQPGHMKVFNLVAGTVALLSTVYSSIDGSTVGLVTQIFATLNEFTSGCQTNRQVLFSNKIIDFMNFILRAPTFLSCTQEQVMEVYHVIGCLLYTLAEENGEEELALAKEVKETVDKDAIFKVMVNMYAKRDPTGPAEDDPALELGFAYYIIYSRFCDIDPKLSKTHPPTPEQASVLAYYRANCMSVEILKEDNLQKITFRVLNKKILREEIKEKVKWAINRTSPSNRIRDFMAWSVDILEDARNQKRILSNKAALFLTDKWILWNYAVILLSVLINVLMLITWDAPLALNNVPSNVTQLPAELFNPQPVIIYPQYFVPAVFTISVLHNCTTFLVFVSYFIANRPQLPDIRKRLDKLVSRMKPKGTPTRAEHKSRLSIHLFSFITLYYFLFLGLSLAGTTFTGYLFAFHLLHIVNMNHLLQGVIKALTKNGKSLLWVAILGVVVFYLYSLVAFALMRDHFDPGEDMYCVTLWQCTVTVVRYGLIGDYKEKFHMTPGVSSFADFGWMAIYQISFFIFITTIGLNVIFGIIVDTFSEHRECKWAAESDMKGFCFICGRSNYDFEHHSQGFTQHVKNDHNMWAYIFFLIHLEDTKLNDYTALDLYVATQLREERYDFFPVNMAMCLSGLVDDPAESKLDSLMDHVQTLVRMQRQKEMERKIKEETLHQQRWQEKHKHRPLLHHWSFGRQGPPIDVEGVQDQDSP